MGTFNTDRNIPSRVRDIVTALAGHDVKIPDVTKAIKELDRIDALRPAELDENTLRAAYADPAATRESIDLVAANVTSNRAALKAWGEARVDAAKVAEFELSTHIETVLEKLRPAAEEAIAELTWYHDNGAPDPGDLIRSGRTKDAERAALVPGSMSRLSALVDLRARTSGKHFPWANAFYRDGDHLDQGQRVAITQDRKLTPLQRILPALDAGAELWWPTYDEAIECIEGKERKALEERKAAADKDRAIRRMAV